MSPPEQRRELGFHVQSSDPVLPEHKDAEASWASNKQAAKAEWESKQSAAAAAAVNAALAQRSARIHTEAAAVWASGMRQQIQQSRASLQAPAQKQELSK